MFGTAAAAAAAVVDKIATVALCENSSSSSSTAADLAHIALQNGCRIVLRGGSVLDFEGDALVNAANNGGVGGFGLDEMVNRAAGDFEIKEARRAFNGIATGDAKCTSSFKHTKVTTIIHAVGPVYRDNRIGGGGRGASANVFLNMIRKDKDKEKESTSSSDQGATTASTSAAAADSTVDPRDALLAKAYESSLDRAVDVQAATVGFCLLSAGVFRGSKPLDEVIQIALSAIINALCPPVQCVVLYAYTTEEQQCCREVIRRIIGNTVV